jgi:fructose-1,6-bisphosphatase/inositol monophosphatase family enzyme
LSEAGGKVTDFHGNALRYDTAARSGANGLVASNGNLHEEVVEKLTDFAI